MTAPKLFTTAEARKMADDFNSSGGCDFAIDDALRSLADQLDAVRKELAKVRGDDNGGWFECKNQMPDHGQRCWTWNGKTAALLTYLRFPSEDDPEPVGFYGPYGEYGEPDYRDQKYGITHWQPVPTPPRTVKEIL